ncbi:MAG: NADH-quinone oxidoreductase subunit N, partial [Abitibacteriaceae bacterium]|nr:NADH-quinone oxidoreductase subunit N [Abditibacteriaceae bacterium]
MTLQQLAQAHNISILAPEVVLSLTAMAVLICGAFFPDDAQRRFLPWLAFLGVLISAISIIPLWNRNLQPDGGVLYFGPHSSDHDTAIYVVDNFSLFFKYLFLFTLAVTISISNRFLTAREGDRHTVVGEYYALLMLSAVGMMMVASARDLLVIFLGIETLSIALYILAGFARVRWVSNEAALKYFLLGAFATGFLLYGIALTYYATGSTLLSQVRVVAANPSLAPPGAGSFTYLYMGLAFILIGLGFKAALVPFHQWTPDVYQGAPTPVTAFMAVGAKAAAFAALLRVFPYAFGTSDAAVIGHKIILVMAVLTMTFGNIVAIEQNSLKRMLAYSAIAHAGYLLIGVLATNSAVRSGHNLEANYASAGVLYYLLAYALMNLGAFAVLVYLENAGATAHLPGRDSEETDLKMDDLRGLARRQPLAAAALTVFLLSLAGIPPTAGW